MLRIRPLVLALALLGALGGLTGDASAAVAPFEGVGQAPATESKGPPPRRQALLRAREAALLEALGNVDVAVDAGARTAVVGQYEAWTGAYRIVEEKNDGATITVKLEVEIDLARLRKRVAKRDASSSKVGFALGPVSGKGACSGLDRTRVEGTLAGFGLLSDAPGAEGLELAVDCKKLGPVPFTHLVSARVEAVARGTRGELARVVVPGFSLDETSAADLALEDALNRIAERLVPRAQGGVELRVEQPWPAARVRQLERSMKQAVLGVEGVELVGLGPDGSVRLHVRGNVDPEGLAAGLRRVELPGFTLGGFRVDSPHALTVRIDG